MAGLRSQSSRSRSNRSPVPDECEGEATHVSPGIAARIIDAGGSHFQRVEGRASVHASVDLTPLTTPRTRTPPASYRMTARGKLSRLLLRPLIRDDGKCEHRRQR